MLFKLLKYDFRSMWKTFSLVWAACLVLALVNRFTLPFEGKTNVTIGPGDGILAFITALVFFGVLFAMFVAVMIFVIQRFYKGLLGDEGYLMNTLPVPTWQLVLSKLICAVFVSIASMLITFLACLILVPIQWDKVFSLVFIRELWEGLFGQPDALLYLFEMCVMVALGLALLTMMVYLAMAVGQMFSHRIVMSVVAFIGLDILATLYLNLTDELELVEMISNLGQHAGLWMANAMILFPTAVLFLATSWLLKHRLNLE